MWRDVIWYDMMWCDMIYDRYNMIYYIICDVRWYMIWCDVIWYMIDIIYVMWSDVIYDMICCLLATSAIMLSEKKKRKRKMWSRKWYLKRNISCDVHLLNELLETDVPWDEAIVVSAGKLRKLWDSLSELRSSVCVWKTTGKDSSEACAIACHNCAVYSVFPSGMTSRSKFSQFNWECTGRFRICLIEMK